MNYFQLLVRRLVQAFAVFRDPNAGLLLPLPEPLVEPRRSADDLARAAHEQGRSDGERYLYDGWSFGQEDDSQDTDLVPEYVRRLRNDCETAINEYRDRNELTSARLADLDRRARDAESHMRAARDRMAVAAVRDRLDEEDSLRAFLGKRNVNADTLNLPPLEAEVWEGEAPPMHPLWKAGLLCFLIAVVFEIVHYVAESYLPATGLGARTVLVMTIAVAGLTVLGPFVSGQLFRHRHATGADRVLTGLTFALLLPTVATVLGFGLVAARLFDRGVTAGTGILGGVDGSQSAALGLTPATLVVVFDVVLVLACTMAYILGLAERHPFQRAFVRNQAIRDRTVLLAQRMGTRINPDFRATPAGGDGDRELAIRHAYFAAENAYYAGLIEAVADPTFTDAVLRRRNLAALPQVVAGGPGAAEGAA
ncbi:hypothetical protein [Luedemannella helvata]|uniref:Uncharacterized protein n=1 Tax=Luedemannella helvata TaxID=349315 RepID=A0ABP4XAR5_9ACTN